MYRTLLSVFLVAQAVSPQCSSSTAAGGGTTTATLNVQSIVVNAGPDNDYFNGAFTSVTICAPGSSTMCQTVGGILVDTGSSGLRVLSSALTVSLPQQTDASGNPIAECNEFQDGYTWGPVQTADVKLAGEVASAVPIQVIGAPAFSTVPAGCVNTGGASENTLADLGANGILGIGVFRQDCGSACALTGSSNPGVYYSCPAAGCQVTAESLTKQVQNPVWLFPTDNNGVVIQFPAVPAAGEATVNGFLMFGIGTQADNALNSATVQTVDFSGSFTTVFRGQSYTSSFIDSGSNGFYLLDGPTTGLALCADNSGFYCPPGPQSLSATNRGINGATTTINFTIDNADTLLNNLQFSVFGTVGGTNAGSVDWGMPFFYGRTVFTAIEGQTTPGGTGPYWAY